MLWLKFTDSTKCNIICSSWHHSCFIKQPKFVQLVFFFIVCIIDEDKCVVQKNQLKLFEPTFVHLYLYIKVHQIVANPSTNLHNNSEIGPTTIFIYIKSAMSLCHSQIPYIDIQYASQAHMMYTPNDIQTSIVNFSMTFCHYSSSFDINWAVSGTDDILWCYQT